MKPIWKYLIKPLGSEYNNKKKIGNQDLIVNTSIENAKYVNRMRIVLAAPNLGEIPVGSKVVVHHNVFRTYFDIKGKQRKSNEYFRDKQYLVDEERIFMYDAGEGWKTTKDYCFVSPVDYIQDSDIHRTEEEKEKHVGLIKISSVYDSGKKIGYTRNSEYEFEIDGEKVYRMRHSDICIEF